MFPGKATKAANRFLSAELRERQLEVAAGRDRAAIVESCAEHLVGMGLDQDEAAHLALATWAQVEAADTRAYVDVSRSTPFMVTLVDQLSGQAWTLTTADLLRLVGPRAVAG